MRIYITGGAGFIGSHLVDQFVGQGHEIIVYDDMSSGKLENLAGPLENGGITLTANFPRKGVLKDAVVYHAAATANIGLSQSKPFEIYFKDLQLTGSILRRAIEDVAERFIFVSSSGVYAQAEHNTEDVTPTLPDTPYAAAKLSGESVVRMVADKIPCVSVRPTNVYGPRQRFEPLDYTPLIPSMLVRMFKGEDLIIDGDGTQSPDLVYVKDCARWLAGLATVDKEKLQGQAVNLGSGASISVNEIVDYMIRITKRKPTVEHGPSRSWYFKKTEADQVRMHTLFSIRFAIPSRAMKETVAYYKNQVEEGKL